MSRTTENIKKMIQSRLNLLIKDSQHVSVSIEEYRKYRHKIEELDWVLTIFFD